MNIYSLACLTHCTLAAAAAVAAGVAVAVAVGLAFNMSVIDRLELSVLHCCCRL